MYATLYLAAPRDATLACVRPREICRRIERLGGEHVYTRGSHRTYVVRYGERGRVTTQVPIHPRDIRPGTLRAIERDLEPVFGKGWLRT
jgi:predicted RNA binding protein YcfA (HicA-like mRNA interferase family)